MTATWVLEAAPSSEKVIALTWFSGRSARPPNFERLTGRIINRNGAVIDKLEFGSQTEADAWAETNGVTQWHLVANLRAFPIAQRIPIQFPEAPDRAKLNECIEAFESGIPLGEIAAGLTRPDRPEVSVHPMLLRAWLIGAAPAHHALQRLR